MELTQIDPKILQIMKEADKFILEKYGINVDVELAKENEEEQNNS